MIKEEFYKLFNDDTVSDLDLHDFVKDSLLTNRSAIPKLFRYSPANYYNIRGVETQSLYLSTIGAMNDIKSAYRRERCWRLMLTEHISIFLSPNLLA